MFWLPCNKINKVASMPIEKSKWKYHKHTLQTNPWHHKEKTQNINSCKASGRQSKATRPRGYKTFSMLNVKMPTIVGILTFISMINLRDLKQETSSFVGILDFLNS